MKIFWSWQSDTHQPSGRYFVRDVLKTVAGALSGSESEEADRPEIEQQDDGDEDGTREPSETDISVDYDTQGVGGSPPIAETILGKIREAAVFVADVTPVGKTTGGKWLPNPNVMIELGYAVRALGHERIVLVMNRAEGGKLDRLPFDLRHWRAPISYSLGRDATDERKAEVAAELRADLRTAIAPCLVTARRAQQAELRRTVREPDLALNLHKDNSGTHVISQAIRLLEVKTATENMAAYPRIEHQKKQNYVIDPMRSKSLNSTLRNMGIKVPINSWDPEDIDGYNRRVENYWGSYDSFLAEYKNYQLRTLRTLDLRFVVANSGTAPATNIDVEVYFPPNVIIYDEDSAPKPPEAPRPPEMSPLGIYGVTTNAVTVPPYLGGIRKSYRIEKAEGIFHFAVLDLKHHHTYNSPPIKVELETVDDIHDFDVQYAVTSNELVDRVEGSITVRVARDDTGQGK